MDLRWKKRGWIMPIVALNFYQITAMLHQPQEVKEQQQQNGNSVILRIIVLLYF